MAKCEGCKKKATRIDSEGIDLCEECYLLRAELAAARKERDRLRRLITSCVIDGVSAVCRKALDALGAALAQHKHKWSKEERSLYDEAIKACGAEAEKEKA